jgi:hypothetical protein
MRQWLRSHMTYANVMVTILAFIVLGGGTALAAYVVSSNSQIGPGTVSGHKPPTGDHANIIAGSVNGQDVANKSLTGAKIASPSGIEACPAPLAKFGHICARSDGTARAWGDAIDYCSSLGLRFPTLSEANTLAENYDVPGVSPTQFFWTDALFYNNGFIVETMGEDGNVQNSQLTDLIQTVCVTDPFA